MTPEQLRAYATRPKTGSGEIVVPPEARLSPAIATCGVCGEGIRRPSDLASATRGFRHVACEEEGKK